MPLLCVFHSETLQMSLRNVYLTNNFKLNREVIMFFCQINVVIVCFAFYLSIQHICLGFSENLPSLAYDFITFSNAFALNILRKRQKRLSSHKFYYANRNSSSNRDPICNRELNLENLFLNKNVAEPIPCCVVKLPGL